MELVSREDFVDTYTSEMHGWKQVDRHEEWFPVEPSTGLARLIADLTSDGHVQGEPKLRFDYVSSDKNDLDRFESLLSRLFGVEGERRQNRTNPYSKSYNYGVNSKPLTRVLILCGVPVGRKTDTCFDIPGWILEDRERFRSYVEGMFSCDGSACASVPRITLELYKESSLVHNLQDYFDTMNRYLERYFDVGGSVFERNSRNERKDGTETVGVGLNIRSRQSIKNFHEEFDITDSDMRREIEGSVAQSGRARD